MTQWRVPLRNFLALWDKTVSDKKNSTKNRDITLWSIKSFLLEISDTVKGSSTKFFGTPWDKIFEKIVILPPTSFLPYPLIHNFFFFDTRNFVKQRRVPLLWDKNFRYSETKTFRRRNLIPPSLMHKIFRYPKLFDTPKCSPTKFFGTLRQKIFEGVFDTAPYPTFLSIIFFRYQKFSETKKGSLTKFFGTVRQQVFYRKSWYSPLRHKLFRYPKFSETQTGSSTKFFGTVRQKFFDGKSWYSRPPLIHKIFATGNFLKEINRVPLRNFWALWDKKFSTENLDTPPPPPSHPNFFDTRN